MRIGIVGNGVVGGAIGRAFAEHVREIRAYDAVSERATHTLAEVAACDVTFLCVPEGGVDGACHMLRRCGETVIIVKSTVPIGTTRRLAAAHRDVVHSPEFLTARCSEYDAANPARVILGLRDASDWARPSSAGRVAFELFAGRWPGTRIHCMTYEESEAVKLAQNAAFAIKVATFNEIHSLCAVAGLEWGRVRAALLADGRMGESHTSVPGPDGRLGFGGACLPKDLAQFAAELRLRGLRADVSEAAMARNVGDRG